MTLQNLFESMHAKQASDMFLTINSPVYFKVNNEIIPLNEHRLSQSDITGLLEETITPSDMATLQTTYELNIGLSCPNIGRFRLSAFYQRGSIAAVLRFIPTYIPTLAELKLPGVLGNLIMEKRGLILVVGATGSGKTTTIASMLNHRNHEKTGHILTLEDPIEYLFRNEKSIVNQREIGTDTQTFEIALHNALRQSPDCILIGEIRDQATMAAAMSYAQSGHLVLATLHANNSYQTLTRIISLFPIEQRSSLLYDLSSAIKCIISQRLVTTQMGNRYPAVEILLNTPHVADLISAGNIGDIREAIDSSLTPGAQTFEQTLIELIEAGLISQQEALVHADSPNNLLWLLENRPVYASVPVEMKEVEESLSFAGFHLK